MFCISVHITPEHSRGFDQQRFLQKVKSIRSPEVDAFEEKNQFHLSFHFFTEYPSDLWTKLQMAVFDQSEYAETLLAISIVTCEGENEDEYWLLHHFDQSQQLDQLK